MVDLEEGWISLIRRHRTLTASILAVLIAISAMVAYAGMWPPVFVVESSSMMHSDTESKLGIIDTGDMVLIQRSSGRDVKTYVDCFVTGDRTYGDYGEVLIYERYGLDQTTPILHRAMMRLEYNSTSQSFDIPSLASLPLEKWNTDARQVGRWWSLSGLVAIYDVGQRSATLLVDLGLLLEVFEQRGVDPHGGLITWGDNNLERSGGVWMCAYDQGSMAICREPIMDDWVVGEPRLEIPWIGLIKLYVTGEMPPDAPENSKTFLVVFLVLMFVVPLTFDFVIVILRSRGIYPLKLIMSRFKNRSP